MAASDKKGSNSLLTYFCLIKKKNRTKLNKPDLALIIDSVNLVSHLIAKRGRRFSLRATSLHTLNPPGEQAASDKNTAAIHADIFN